MIGIYESENHNNSIIGVLTIGNARVIMSQLIDRRQNGGKKSTVNRQRFLRRYKNQIKQALKGIKN